MQALLLCAGFGTRLRTFTKIAPKPLMPIHGHACLEYWLLLLNRAGFDEVIINTHYKSELIEEFVSYLQLDFKITLVFEDQLLGTAGAVRNVLPMLNDNLFVIHSDNFGPRTFTEFVNFVNVNCESNKMIGSHFKTSQPEKCGIVEIDSDDRVISFIEKPNFCNSDLANAAIYYLPSSILSLISEGRMTDISNDLLPEILVGSKSFYFSGEYIDIGEPRNLILANYTKPRISYPENKELENWYEKYILIPFRNNLYRWL